MNILFLSWFNRLSFALSLISLLFILAWAFPEISYAQQNEEIQRIMKEIRKSTDELSALTAKMKQRKISSFMEKETVTKSDFYYKKPGRYVIAPARDEENKYNITPEDIWIINKKNKTILVTTDKDADLSQYFTGFGDNQTTLENNFDMRLESTQKIGRFLSYKIVMLPLKSSKLHGKMDKVVVYIRDDLWMPYGLELYESDGDITIWEFTNIRKNPVIRDEVFKREIPNGYTMKKMDKKK